MSQNPNHPPRLGVRRFVHESRLDSEQGRLLFAGMIKAIAVCGLAAEISVNDANAGLASRFMLYVVKRERSVRAEK